MLTILNRARSLTQPVIVMYHRVADLAVDPWGLAVSPANFASQIAAFATTRQVLPMSEFATRAGRGALPRGALAITFDDGYLDNLEIAAPVLTAGHLPATVFVATGPGEAGEAFWWDRLADVVLDAEACSAIVEIGSAAVPIELGDRELDDDRRREYRAWQPRTARERLYLALWERFRALAAAAVEDGLAALAEVLGSPPTTGRAMRPDELARLASVEGIEFGAHTADHRFLPDLPPAEAREQIRAGKQRLAELTGAEPAGFAYPYGGWSRAVRDMADEAGFAWACTTASTPVPRRPDRLALPRIAAPNVAGIGWLGAARG